MRESAEMVVLQPPEARLDQTLPCLRHNISLCVLLFFFFPYGFFRWVNFLSVKRYRGFLRQKSNPEGFPSLATQNRLQDDSNEKIGQCRVFTTKDWEDRVVLILIASRF